MRYRNINPATLSSLYMRFALGTTFLYSVGDRFGLWGVYGTRGVNWGDFDHFLHYTAKITAFMPHQWTSTLGWCATILELTFGVCLVLGLCTRVAAVGSGLLLLIFALSMTATTGLGSALTLSVFSASAGAFTLGSKSVLDDFRIERKLHTWLTHCGRGTALQPPPRAL